MKCNGSLIAALVVIICAGRTQADEKEGVGNGAKAWATALMEGDTAAVKARSIGGEEDMARWQGMSKMIGAFKKLGDAASAKYGEEGAALAKAFRKPDFSQVTAEAKIEVNGDDASVTGKDGKVMKLKKDGGEWKVMLSSLADSGKMDVKQVTAMTEAVSSTADEIKDGKYATYIDAMKALAQKMAAAGGKRPGPAK